jgi:hypothetical protein
MFGDYCVGLISKKYQYQTQKCWNMHMHVAWRGFKIRLGLREGNHPRIMGGFEAVPPDIHPLALYPLSTFLNQSLGIIAWADM